MDIRKIVKNRTVRKKIMYSLSFLPNSIYLSLFYRSTTGRWPNLKNPKGFNEKLMWLKINDIHPEYNQLADKLRVRKHVEKILGPGFTFPVLGVWKSGDDIDFQNLPNEFVLKCNHDSGSYRIIKDKSKLSEREIKDLRNYYNHRLSEDFYYAGRDYSYKGIEPKVFAEKLMRSSSDGEGGIKDFKFFCFNGEPKLMLMVNGRQTEKHEDYFDMDFNRLHIENGWTESKICPPKPSSFEEMKKMAATLSKGIRQVRMDFYEIDGKPYFGEYTFFSGGGYELFHPDEWERRLGDWIDLG